MSQYRVRCTSPEDDSESPNPVIDPDPDPDPVDCSACEAEIDDFEAQIIIIKQKLQEIINGL